MHSQIQAVIFAPCSSPCISALASANGVLSDGDYKSPPLLEVSVPALRVTRYRAPSCCLGGAALLFSGW
jgi:hypothetical protein